MPTYVFKYSIPRDDLSYILNSNNPLQEDIDEEFVQDKTPDTASNFFEREAEAALKVAKRLVKKHGVVGEFSVDSYRHEEKRANAVRVIMKFRTK